MPFENVVVPERWQAVPWDSDSCKSLVSIMKIPPGQFQAGFSKY
jgi:hypothetical protein